MGVFNDTIDFYHQWYKLQQRGKTPKHSGSQELFEFFVICSITDAKLIF